MLLVASMLLNPMTIKSSAVGLSRRENEELTAVPEPVPASAQPPTRRAPAPGLHLAAPLLSVPGYPTRAPVPADKRSWDVSVPGYRPPAFTHSSVFLTGRKQGWADPVTVTATRAERAFSSFEGEVRFGPAISLRDPVTAQWMDVPLNPRGRTGLEGRGKLGRWGANGAGDAVLTRNNPETGQFEFFAIDRKDGGGWAVPGGMKDGDETGRQAAERELFEETGVRVDWSGGKTLYEGYVDDPRNTDNAWMETTVRHLHLDFEASKHLHAWSKSEVKEIAWLPATDDTLHLLYASHADFIRAAVQSLEDPR